MNKDKALFICNSKFLDAGYPGGGVKLCTDEFREMLATRFDLTNFPVEYTKSILHRAKQKFGFSAYSDYDPNAYREALRRATKENDIRYFFLNLTNTAPFAAIVKSLFPQAIVVLCSHGNESGDYLHDVSRHKKFEGLKKVPATYTLGKLLLKEAEQRKHIDLVLTVSDAEEGIEKWLGASKVYMVPRFIADAQAPYLPVKGRVGFFSDLSHEPNYYGISEVCKELAKLDHSGLELRLAGGGTLRGNELAASYSFVKYLNYLPEEKLAEEISTWTFALNPVFYYSRGVSTKLGRSLGAGLPAITTYKGLRGYRWAEGDMPVCNNAPEMAALIIELSHNTERCQLYQAEVRKIQRSAPSYQSMMQEISRFI